MCRRELGSVKLTGLELRLVEFKSAGSSKLSTVCNILSSKEWHVAVSQRRGITFTNLKI